MHQNDSSLDDPIPQEYILYLIPTGPLGAALDDFWTESLRVCGWNRTHGSFPHITLCDFFTCEDRKVPSLYTALVRAGDLVRGAFPQTISLSLYSSSSFIGFFINNGPVAIIKGFVETFCAEATKLAGCTVKPLARDFHMTLAHKFPPHLQGTLEHLAKSLHPAQSCEWEAVLISRDMRFVHYQTLRALFHFTPEREDEMKLCLGEIVFVDRSSQSYESGWLMAVSHRTGCRGFVPENFLEKDKETSTWIKHRCYKFRPDRKPDEMSGSAEPRREEATPAIPPTNTHSLLVVSHGESVDQVFGRTWLSKHALTEGLYKRLDLNLPSKLPIRGDVLDFEWDPPLSSCGMFQASLVGMRLDRQVQIWIDWSLYDWGENSVTSSSRFMTPLELVQNGYNVDFGNSALPNSVPRDESHTENLKVDLGRLLKRSGQTSGFVTLIVGHGRSLVPLVQDVLGVPRGREVVTDRIPALALCLCEEEKDGCWSIKDPPVKSLTHGSNPSFQWTSLI